MRRLALAHVEGRGWKEGRQEQSDRWEHGRIGEATGGAPGHMLDGVRAILCTLVFRLFSFPFLLGTTTHTCFII